MKPQMKWFSTSTLFLVLATVFSHAQSVEMKVKIPFSFVAEDRKLPAGEYVVTRNGGGMELMRVAQNDAPGSVTLIPIPIEGRADRDRGRLIFNRYGDHYFLSEVWIANDTVGHKLHLSSAEGDASKDRSERVTVPALQKRR